MADIIFDSFWEALVKGDIDFDVADFRYSLMTGNYTPSKGGDIGFPSIASLEATGANYTDAGKTLTNVTITKSTTANRVTIDYDDVTWTTSTIPDASYGLIYYDGHASDVLVLCHDFGGTQASSNGDFTVAFDVTGI